jgi:nicotinamidase/pyrazinamidase
MGDSVALTRGDALVIVDVQNDFVSGGALAVPHGDEVIPVLNRYIRVFDHRALPIYATRDWHPNNHCSFQTQGGPWPVHCVVDSHGASFVPSLALPQSTTVISKPSAPQFETFSAFAKTDFAEQLRHANVRRLFIGGLAIDYCVLHTALDALKHGFEIFLLKDAVRAVNVHPNDGAMAETQLVSAGAKTISIGQLQS